METHAVLAAWDEERLTVWIGSQTPFRARDAVADALGVPPSSVRVIVPPTGSGFGGKHAAELAVGAARLAKATGRPVRITYTREEEFTEAYLRPMAIVDIRSGAEKDGRLTAWQFSDLNPRVRGRPHSVQGGEPKDWQPARRLPARPGFLPGARCDSEQLRA